MPFKPRTCNPLRARIVDQGCNLTTITGTFLTNLTFACPTLALNLAVTVYASAITHASKLATPGGREREVQRFMEGGRSARAEA